MQLNDAELVRVYTRESGGTIAEVSPHVSAGSLSFEVIIEAEAGQSRFNNLSPYTILLTAFDVTAGASATAISAAFNPAPLNQIFTSTKASLGSGVANNITPWAAYEQKFVITLTTSEAAAATNHVFQYTAVLFATGSDPIVSIAQSPLFVLV